jgi:major outer membrane protein
MKKLTMTLLTVLSCGAAYALPVGNPADASLFCNGIFYSTECCADEACTDVCDPCFNSCSPFSLRFGFYGDYVVNRNLGFTFFNGRNERSHVNDLHVYTNAGLAVLNFFNRVDFFATLGASDFQLNSYDIAITGSMNPSPGHTQVDTNTQFSWSVGGRATLWQWGNTTLGAEGQFFRFSPSIVRIGNTSARSNYESQRLHYSEWQVGLGLAQRINMLVPYAAVKYSRPEVQVPNAGVLLEGDKRWGYAIGMTLLGNNTSAVTAEVRLGDEKALHINGQVRF